MAADAPYIRLINVVKRFEAPEGVGSLTVLDGVSLEAQAGESLAIVGPSGSGKSTLLHLLGTLDRPTSGEVLVGGRNLSALDEGQLAWVRNREIGFVFQAHYLLPQCTVMENVLVPTLAHKAGKRTSVASASSTSKQPQKQGVESTSARALRLLSRVGLGERLAHRPGQLSGGERQRVALVRALVNAPSLLLADEPTGSLDQDSAQELARLLLELNREEQVTLVLVTHSKDLASGMRRVLELRHGHLLPGPHAPESGSAGEC